MPIAIVPLYVYDNVYIIIYIRTCIYMFYYVCIISLYSTVIMVVKPTSFSLLQRRLDVVRIPLPESWCKYYTSSNTLHVHVYACVCISDSFFPVLQFAMKKIYDHIIILIVIIIMFWGEGKLFVYLEVLIAGIAILSRSVGIFKLNTHLLDCWE